MNVGKAKTLLKRYGFDDSDPLLEWLNAAQHLFEGAADWPWLRISGTFIMNPGEYQVNSPNDQERVALLKDVTNNVFIPYKSPGEFMDEIVDFTTSGKPQLYTILDSAGGDGTQNVLQLWPVLDVITSFFFVYRRSLPDLADDGEDLALPLKYQYAVPVGAAAIALQAENEEERSQTAWSQFNGYIDLARADYDAQQLGEAGQVRDVMGYFEDSPVA